MTERELGHHFTPNLAGMFPRRCIACGGAEDTSVHHETRLKSLYERQLCEVTTQATNWLPCRKPWAPGRFVCADHALEQDRQAQELRDAQEADAKDLVHSLGAP